MAGIKVPQYEVFKIGTYKLKANNWDLNITRDDAFKLEELISLFEAREFKLIAKIINKPIWKIDFKKYILSIVIENMSHFSRATSNKGIKVNGITYKRFVGTTGGLKNNTLLFINSDILDQLNELCECKRNKDIPLVPAKYEAYKALTCSASQEIISPNKILVVRDCITQFNDTVIYLDNSNEENDNPEETLVENMNLENNVSDGFNLCTINFMKKISEKLGLDYITSGVCLRNAWFKGMLYPFPIMEFIEKYNNGNYFIEDIWGNIQDIRECEMIATESSLKLWSAYDSIESYMNAYKECGYEFSVTKISPHKLEDSRELNYQYIQSYNLSDEDIEELCSPTVKYLKDSLCGDYESTIKFLGITENSNEMFWQKALYTSEYMLGDPYIIDSVHRMIKKKINEAKIGKLFVDGNYQIASGDPFALMQSICGLEVTGLLKADEVYSNYWNDKSVDEVVVFRSPMTSHNNIRKCKLINNDEVNYWYQYMDTIMIINGWDTFCAAANGCDFDSDILFSSNNRVLLDNHIKLPAILCAQQNTDKVIVTENNIKKTNKNGMGNKVGSITNRVTTMIEVQSHFSPTSQEYKDLSHRIACGQLYQQDELDKIKGIIARPMPTYWFNDRACKGDEYLKSICAYKKPYFMVYVYDDYRVTYNKYIKECDIKCNRLYGCTINELYALEDKTEEQIEFLRWFEIKSPFGMGDCAMNKVCKHVEKEFNGYKSGLKHNSNFDYNKLKVKRRCTEKHRTELLELCKEYGYMVDNYRKKTFSRDDKFLTQPLNIYGEEEYNRNFMKDDFYKRAKEICPNDDERLNIILDMCYGSKNNRQFCWDCVGDLILQRLEEINNATIDNESV